jgi:hypothetical protein
MDKVQITDRSNTAPSSKTFRDEQISYQVSLSSINQLQYWCRTSYLCPAVFRYSPRTLTYLCLYCGMCSVNRILDDDVSATDVT